MGDIVWYDMITTPLIKTWFDISSQNLASPQAAGVAALILSAPEFYNFRALFKEYARVVKSIIRKLSYPRSTILLPYEERSPKVLWNGVDLYKDPDCTAGSDDSLGQCSISTVPVMYVILSSYYLCIIYA
jgi:hypothetical protein